MQETDNAPTKESLNVLIVEDDPSVALLVKDTLEELEHKAMWAKSAEEAEEILHGMPPNFHDLIYLDIQLPGLNGIDLCRFSRTWPHPDAPTKRLAGEAWIVAMTALTSTEDIISMLSAGANDYITKPITPQIIRIKTTVCLFAMARKQAFLNRIRILEDRMLKMTAPKAE
jgi:DNA-binding response OmpR family regulator